MTKREKRVSLEVKRDKIDLWRILVATIAGTGLLASAAQLLITYFKGEGFCVNQGCRIVENASSLPPWLLNSLGLFLFLLILALSLSKGRRWTRSLLSAVLVTAMAAEGVLVGFQALVAHSFCTYCLFIFSLILLASLASGWRTLLSGAGAFASVLFLLNLLQFGQGITEVSYGLDKGTYGIRSCSNPEKKMYLIFSQQCPHCQKVLRTLEGCSKCEFRFNPVSRIKDLGLSDLKVSPKYDPSINVTALKILGINSVPVLIDVTSSGLIFIKGDEPIIKYIRSACFFQKEDPLKRLSTRSNPFATESSDICSMDALCGTDN